MIGAKVEGVEGWTKYVSETIIKCLLYIRVLIEGW